jgi:parvulin-like peptidyl-prolyl isomerase
MALMNRMRQNTKTILLILVGAFIGTIIFNWGMGGVKQTQTRGVIGEVNGDEISYDEFYNQYQSQMAQYRERSGEDPEGYQLQQLENQVFEGLVQQRLIADYIQKMNLEATNEEVVQTIFNDPPELIKNQEVFRDSAGNFDMEKYQQALKNPGADWLPVENYVRASLPYEKLDRMLKASVLVSETDTYLEYLKQNAKIRIDYLFFNATNYADEVQTPGDTEILEYYQQHKEDYHENERRSLKYAFLETSATSADTQRIYNEAEELLQEAKEGTDFGELAKIYSQDPGSAQKNGDLGYFGRGQMVKPFEEAAFNAREGDIVGPVTSQFGVHIIKVVDKKREQGEMQVRASHILLKFEASPMTVEAQREEAEYISEFAKETNLDTVVQAEGIETQITPPFEKEAFIPGIGMEQRINRFAFRSEVGTVSSVYNTAKGFYVVEIAEVIPEHTKPLEEVRNQIINKLEEEKRMQVAKNRAQRIYEQIQQGTPLDEAAMQDSLQVKSSDLVNVSASITGIGREPRVAGAAYALQVGEISKPVKGSRGYYLIQLVDKKDIDEETYAGQKQSLLYQLINQRQNMIYNQWYTRQKEKSNIEDYRGMYF